MHGPYAGCPCPAPANTMPRPYPPTDPLTHPPTNMRPHPQSKTQASQHTDLIAEQQQMANRPIRLLLPLMLTFRAA